MQTRNQIEFNNGDDYQIYSLNIDHDHEVLLMASSSKSDTSLQTFTLPNVTNIDGNSIDYTRLSQGFDEFRLVKIIPFMIENREFYAILAIATSKDRTMSGAAIGCLQFAERADGHMMPPRGIATCTLPNSCGSPAQIPGYIGVSTSNHLFYTFAGCSIIYGVPYPSARAILTGTISKAIKVANFTMPGNVSAMAVRNVRDYSYILVLCILNAGFLDSEMLLLEYIINIAPWGHPLMKIREINFRLDDPLIRATTSDFINLILPSMYGNFVLISFSSKIRGNANAIFKIILEESNGGIARVVASDKSHIVYDMIFIKPNRLAMITSNSVGHRFPTYKLYKFSASAHDA